MCTNKKDECFLNECKECSDKDMTVYKEKIVNSFIEEDIEEIRWENTDRSTLISKILILPIEEFVEYLFIQLQILKPHSFIAKKQSEFMEYKKKQFRRGRGNHWP